MNGKQLPKASVRVTLSVIQEACTRLNPKGGDNQTMKRRGCPVLWLSLMSNGYRSRRQFSLLKYSECCMRPQHRKHIRSFSFLFLGGVFFWFVFCFNSFPVENKPRAPENFTYNVYIYIYISNKGTAQKLEWANPPWRIIISTIGQLNTAGPSSRKEQQNCQLQNEDYLRDAHSHLEARGWGDVTVGECWTEQNLAADHTGVCIYIYICVDESQRVCSVTISCLSALVVQSLTTLLLAVLPVLQISSTLCCTANRLACTRKAAETCLTTNSLQIKLCFGDHF